MSLSADEAAKLLGVFLYSSVPTVEAAYIKNSEANALENAGNPAALAEAQNIIDEAKQVLLDTIESYSVHRIPGVVNDLSSAPLTSSGSGFVVDPVSVPYSNPAVTNPAGSLGGWSSSPVVPGAPLNYRANISEVKFSADYDTLYKNPRTSDPLWIWGAVSTLAFVVIQLFRIFGSAFSGSHHFVFTTLVGGELIATLVGLFFVFWISAGIPARFRRRWDRAWLGFIFGYLVVAPIVFFALVFGVNYGVPLFNNLQAGRGWSFTGETQGQIAANQQFIEQYEGQGFHVAQGTGKYAGDIVVYAPLTGQLVTYAAGTFIQPKGIVDPALAN